MAQPHAVELVVDNSGSAGTKRRRLADELKRHLRHRMFYRHACPLGPGSGSRRSSGATLAAGVTWGQRATPTLVGVRGVFFVFSCQLGCGGPRFGAVGPFMAYYAGLRIR